jgi:uncharacterized SAM-binding protein YcdF (DUF218 family)
MSEVNAKPASWKVRLKRWGKRLAIVLGVLVLLYLLRFPILRAIGNYLVVEDPLVHADVAYVLGGGALDRGTEAARVFNTGLVDRFVCTGAPVPGDLKLWGLPYTESECTRKVLMDDGVPGDRVEAFKIGTSTREEMEALLQKALQEHVDTVMIISHGFHMRRVKYVFKEAFAEKGITVLLHPSPSPQFDTEKWWQSESGLLMVYCEYAKLVYYHLR